VRATDSPPPKPTDYPGALALYWPALGWLSGADAVSIRQDQGAGWRDAKSGKLVQSVVP
jgi:hypothetical protein